MKSQISVLLTLIVLVLIASCGKSNPASGNDEDPPGPPTNPGIATKDIGPAGGSLTSKDGLLTLNIPAGALGQEESITIEKITADDLGSEFDDIEVKNAYELGPSGLEFDIPVEISFGEDQNFKISEDSMEVTPALFLTSENGNAAWLDSTESVADADENNLRTNGLLSHFSPLVLTDGPLTVRYGGIPDTIYAGPDNFRITVGGEVDLNMINSDRVLFAESPLEPLVTDNVNGGGRSEILILNDGLFFTRTNYRCPVPGDGDYKSVVSIPYDEESGRGYSVVTSKIIKCLPAPERVLSVTLSGDGTGSVSSDPAGIDCPEDCIEAYEQDTPVTLTATAATGSEFAGWSGDIGSENDQNPEIQLTMDQARSVTVSFNTVQAGGSVQRGVINLPDLTKPETGVVLGGPMQRFANFPEGSVPALFQGTEGMIVRDLTTGQNLFERKFPPFNDNGNRIPLGAIAVTRPDPGPNTMAVIASYGQDFNNTEFGFNAVLFDTQTGTFPTDAASPYPSTIDAFPVGGKVISDEILIIRDGGNGINFYRYNSISDQYVFRPRTESFTSNRYGFEQPIAAYSQVVEGPMLVINESGNLYYDTRNKLIPAALIGNLGSDIRKMRCEIPVCVAPDFTTGIIYRFIWDGQNQPEIVQDTLRAGDGPIDPDLYSLSDGNILIGVAGFNDNTITLTVVEPNGVVISSTTFNAPPALVNPGHLSFFDNPDDQDNPFIIVTGYGSNNYYLQDRIEVGKLTVNAGSR